MNYCLRCYETNFVDLIEFFILLQQTLYSNNIVCIFIDSVHNFTLFTNVDSKY